MNGFANANANTSPIPTNSVIAIVDPYSTGCCVALEAIKRGYKLVVVWTDGIGENKTHVPTSCVDVRYYGEVEEQQDGATESGLDATAKLVRAAALPYPVVGCICGGESGVAYCDALSENMGLRTVRCFLTSFTCLLLEWIRHFPFCWSFDLF